jgi:metal-responsive CopG/Arc/MetJ family transcriptional regulator
MRVSVSLTDEMVITIDEEAKKRGISRSDLVANAVQSYITDIQAGLQVNQAMEATLKAKEDEISFLRGHISQLTQSISQFALKPGEEEIKKNGWWKFWK